MIGTTLAHFKITGKLGEGGMGEVYRAEDTKLGREVAIKVLPEMVAADEERLARFEREAKLLASLNHPNIGAIYSLESAQIDAVEESPEAAGLRAGRPDETRTVKFLVLELIEGDTLAEALTQGPLGIEKTLQIGQQIALALRGILRELTSDQPVTDADTGDDRSRCPLGYRRLYESRAGPRQAG
jgi:serine/threonine-protein kinase